MAGISILILTLNEEANLSGCLESVKWSDDVVVYDSFSTDRTVEIAQEQGVRVEQRYFDNFANQRNAALHEIIYRNKWVLMLDADERVPHDLFLEMSNVVESVADDISMFRIRRLDHLFGKCLKRANSYPTWFGRLVRPEKVTVERIVNEEYVTSGRIGYLKGHIIHHSYSAGFSAWLITQNRHSSMEADIKVNFQESDSLRLLHLFSKDPLEKRKALKQVALRLPFRPALVFCYWYVMRLGFLEGKVGFHHCMLRAFYEYLLNLKVIELKRKSQGLGI